MTQLHYIELRVVPGGYVPKCRIAEQGWGSPNEKVKFASFNFFSKCMFTNENPSGNWREKYPTIDLYSNTTLDRLIPQHLLIVTLITVERLNLALDGTETMSLL
jgi:hypothetical protein